MVRERRSQMPDDIVPRNLHLAKDFARDSFLRHDPSEVVCDDDLVLCNCRCCTGESIRVSSTPVERIIVMEPETVIFHHALPFHPGELASFGRCRSSPRRGAVSLGRVRDRRVRSVPNHHRLASIISNEHCLGLEYAGVNSRVPGDRTETRLHSAAWTKSPVVWNISSWWSGEYV